MEMSNCFHRGVELSVAQCDALDPVQRRHLGRGFKSYAEMEDMIDQLLSAAGCPIEPALRTPSMIELGREANLYYCQVDDRRVIAGNDFEARSMGDAVRQLLEKHGRMLQDRQLPADVAEQFPDTPAALFHEVSGDRWRIRVVMILPNMRPAMLHHLMVAR